MAAATGTSDRGTNASQRKDGRAEAGHHLAPDMAAAVGRKRHRRAVRMDRPAGAEMLPGCGPAVTGPQQVTDQNLDRDCTNLRPGEPRPVRLSKPLAAFRVTLRVSQLPVESQFTSGPW